MTITYGEKDISVSIGQGRISVADRGRDKKTGRLAKGTLSEMNTTLS